MELDNLTVAIRPRTAWEAVDLGIILAKRWWLLLIKVWLILTFPVLLLCAFLPLEWLWLQYVIIWWLKPLFERPLLDVLSQTVFGRVPSTSETLASFPKLVLRQLFASLTWRRLSPTRSFDLPVLQLEGLGGATRTTRLSVLHREGTGPAIALTIYGVLIEFFVAVAVISFVFLFIPQDLNISWDRLYTDMDTRWVMYAVNGLAYLASSAVVPFYVATGFALYLNRRIRLEGWDIEIAFKRIVQSRTEEKPTSKSISTTISVLVACLLVVTSSSLMPSKVHAEESVEGEVFHAEKTVEDADASQLLIQEIKRGDEFNRRKQETKRYFDWSRDEDGEQEDEEESWANGWGALFGWIPSAGEYLLWSVVIIFVLFLVFRYREWLVQFSSFSVVEQKRRAPSVLFGLEVTQESLPDDISEFALNNWEQGNKRSALALLYRACLFQLIEGGVDLRDGDTEGICLKKVFAFHKSQNLSEGKRDYFHLLTKLWQSFAYGHIEPDNEQAVGLCRTWNEVWQMPGSPDTNE